MSFASAIITFASGVADPPGAETNYYLCAYKAEAVALGATASSGDIPTTTSLNVTVNPDAATKQLVFATQPAATATAGVNLTTQPVVSVRDQSGNVFTTATDSITLAAVLASDGVTAGGGTLNATTNPLNASGGAAAFAGVNYTKAEDVRLKISRGGPGERAQQYDYGKRGRGLPGEFKRPGPGDRGLCLRRVHAHPARTASAM